MIKFLAAVVKSLNQSDIPMGGSFATLTKLAIKKISAILLL